MANETYGVAVTNRVRSAYVGHLEHVVYDDGDLENGMVCHPGDFKEDEERQLREAKQPKTATFDSDPILLICDPELRYEEFRTEDAALEKYKIEAGNPARAYRLEVGDIFSVSKNMVDALSGDEPEVDNYVVAQNEEWKLGENDGTSGDFYDDYRFVGKIIRKDTLGTEFVIGSDGTVGRKLDMVVIEVVQN